MTHELFQNYPALGAFLGMTTPFGNPGLQGHGINPAGGLNPQLQNPPQTGIFQNPLVAANWQNPLIAAYLQNPMWAAGLQNPLIAASLQNPLQYGQQQHSPYSQAGQFGSPYGQIGSPFGQFGSPYGQGGPYGQPGQQHGQFGSPYGQIGSPFGQLGQQQFGSPYGQAVGSPYGQTGSPFGQTGLPLAPQTWVGQGQPFGHMNPLAAYATARLFQTPGISPWASSPWCY